MKLTLDLGNLESNLENNLDEIIRKAIHTEIGLAVTRKVEEIGAETIEETVQSEIKRIVLEKIESNRIYLGGGLTGDSVEMTIEEYMKKTISDELDGNYFRVSDRYNSNKKVTFEEYVTKHFNLDKLIEDKLNKFVQSLRDEINSKTTEMFSQATRGILSEAIFNILKDNEAYQKMSMQIKQIAGGNDEG